MAQMKIEDRGLLREFAAQEQKGQEKRKKDQGKRSA
jgi:hypothetical protein